MRDPALDDALLALLEGPPSADAWRQLHAHLDRLRDEPWFGDLVARAAESLARWPDATRRAVPEHWLQRMCMPDPTELDALNAFRNLSSDTIDLPSLSAHLGVALEEDPEAAMCLFAHPRSMPELALCNTLDLSENAYAAFGALSEVLCDDPDPRTQHLADLIVTAAERFPDQLPSIHTLRWTWSSNPYGSGPLLMPTHLPQLCRALAPAHLETTPGFHEDWSALLSGTIRRLTLGREDDHGGLGEDLDALAQLPALRHLESLSLPMISSEAPLVRFFASPHLRVRRLEIEVDEVDVVEALAGYAHLGALPSLRFHGCWDTSEEELLQRLIERTGDLDLRRLAAS